MNLELEKFQRQFWKADSEYFQRIIFSLPLIADFGGEIVMKPPFFFIFSQFFCRIRSKFSKIHISHELRAWKILKTVLKGWFWVHSNSHYFITVNCLIRPLLNFRCVLEALLVLCCWESFQETSFHHAIFLGKYFTTLKKILRNERKTSIDYNFLFIPGQSSSIVQFDTLSQCQPWNF